MIILYFSVYSEVLQVESLTLAFDVIDLLLQGKKDQVSRCGFPRTIRCINLSTFWFQNSTPLEQTLATQSLKRRTGTSSFSSPIHLVAVIASYVHHRDNPKVPAGAIKLLTRLSQVSPMSVYACLGSESVAVRDAYLHRLKSRLEVRNQECNLEDCIEVKSFTYSVNQLQSYYFHSLPLRCTKEYCLRLPLTCAVVHFWFASMYSAGHRVEDSHLGVGGGLCVVAARHDGTVPQCTNHKQ